MTHDKTLYVGAIGFFGSLTLAQVHLLLSCGVALASLGYVLTKWGSLVYEIIRDRKR